jgi:predicted GIY-YIG superfamily endonuclease
MLGWIYKIINTKNDKIYIGSTTDFETRRRQHFSEYGRVQTVRLDPAMREIGKQYFKMIALARRAQNTRALTIS